MSAVKTIAVIGAMEQEIELLKSRLEQAETETFGTLSAWSGLYCGHRVVLVLSGIGKVNAAVATAWVVFRFRPDYVVNTGSAGGLAGGLKVGDVVIGTHAVHHDADVTAFGYRYGQLPGQPPLFESDAMLVETAFRAAAFDGAAVYQGLIGSGDQFVHSSETAAEIRRNFPDIQAVEMEAAAIAQTCARLQTPFVLIRAISDSADEKADISFDEFLKTAAVHSAETVTAMLKAL
ncbi:5'-methylthioadenosine/adenosylhomocysteine nucleosidase [Neisseria sp.]|uniref:5'-methylthioadenosine/adenosylhomocysteine nucleosidase n=1 Tax=Neisseria sp. TaxID=192066 RepID=UPI0035A0B9BB